MASAPLHEELARALRADPLVELRWHLLSDLDAAVAAAGLDPAAVPFNMFKRCAAARLKLPFALIGADGGAGIIILDWDTIVTCDLTLLFDEELAAMRRDGQLFGLAANDPTRASPRNDMYSKDWRPAPSFPAPDAPPGAAPLRGVNSGVMLVNMDEMRRDGARRLRAWYGELGALIERRVVAGAKAPPADAAARRALLGDVWALNAAFPLGDQDVLNEWLAGRESSMRLLSPMYNSFEQDMLSDAEQRAANFSRTPVPCIHHFTGERLNPGARLPPNVPNQDFARGLHAYILGLRLNLPPE